MSPVTRVPGTTSFIRFKVRMKVDLPHPDGPMMAVTLFFVAGDVEALQGLFGTIEEVQVFRFDFRLWGTF